MKPRLTFLKYLPLLVPAALIAVLFLAVPSPTGLLSVSRAQESKPQTPEEAKKALEEIMKTRKAVVGLTRRGQSIDQAPPFEASPRKPYLDMYPCSDCHGDQVADRRVRKLTEEHTDIVFDHGNGRFWCYDACHDPKNMDHLISFRGQPIDYDQVYKLCGECHFERQKDWYFGGHGKRVGAFPDSHEVPLTPGKLLVKDRKKIGTWEGKRKILNCTACHNPHSPSIKPFEASPPPKVRSGLTRKVVAEPAPEHIWNEVAKPVKGSE